DALADLQDLVPPPEVEQRLELAVATPHRLHLESALLRELRSLLPHGQRRGRGLAQPQLIREVAVGERGLLAQPELEPNPDGLAQGVDAIGVSQPAERRAADLARANDFVLQSEARGKVERLPRQVERLLVPSADERHACRAPVRPRELGARRQTLEQAN